MSDKIEYKQGEVLNNCLFLKELPYKLVGKKQVKIRMGMFQCKCGKIFEAAIYQVRSKNTNSCGCYRDSKIKDVGLKSKTHGKRNHPLYKVWSGMNRRCDNPKDDSYYNYGGRGITVCDRWKDINNFIDDMYPTYIKGLDIDRIDVNGNYEPSNCRWVTRKQNMNNIRRNRIIEYNGIKKTVSEWSDITGIHYKCLIMRLNRWDVNKAFTYVNPYRKIK